MVRIYKCPNCGGNMLYDPEKKLLLCESCGSTKNPNEFDETDIKEEENKSEENGAVHYKCPSCGAELVTDEHTSATICAYCGSPNIIEDRLNANFKPDRIIPFKYNRDYTIKAIRKWCNDGIFSPADLLSKSNLDKVTGVYVPFWLYDIYTNTDMSATATKVRVYRRGDTEYTETSRYDVYRNVDAEFNKIPADASIKMDDQLMDLIEPFNYSELTDFEMSYMSGYMAEKYNYTSEELENRAIRRTDKYSTDLARGTISGYDSVSILSSDVRSNIENSEYVLLPVWIYNYRYNKKDYKFIMNGQTGKIIGKPPISKARIFGVYLSSAIAVFLILKLIVLFAGGKF